MSVILTAAMRKKARDISKRDMTKKRKIIRKVGQLGIDGKPKLTTSFDVDTATPEKTSEKKKVSFSRDILHVWVDGTPVETTAYITDSGYDVDLFFDFCGRSGHIYSDVEGKEMMNYLLVDDELIGQEYQAEK
ncbi:hypothetical protein ScPMuIL_018424 [Solemya velum]